jgi:hypothetical protein
MFPLWVRLLLIAAMLGRGSYLIYSGDRTGYLGIAAAMLFVYGYFRYGTVWLAWRAAQKGKLDAAQRLLAQNRFPSALTSQSRAYHEFLSGVIAFNHGQDSDAERHLRTSLNFAFRTENDRCLAEVTLAELLAKNGITAEVRELISQASRRDCKPEIFARINNLSTTA